VSFGVDGEIVEEIEEGHQAKQNAEERGGGNAVAPQRNECADRPGKAESAPKGKPSECVAQALVACAATVRGAKGDEESEKRKDNRHDARDACMTRFLRGWGILCRLVHWDMRKSPNEKEVSDRRSWRVPCASMAHDSGAGSLDRPG
jgi:hypothetical protein